MQYDEDDWLPGKWRNLSTYPGNLNSVILQLTPYTYYEFRVIAINAIGPSRPSRVSARLQTGGARESSVTRREHQAEVSWVPHRSLDHSSTCPVFPLQPRTSFPGTSGESAHGGTTWRSAGRSVLSVISDREAL